MFYWNKNDAIHNEFAQYNSLIMQKQFAKNCFALVQQHQIRDEFKRDPDVIVDLFKLCIKHMRIIIKKTRLCVESTKKKLKKEP